MCIHTQFILKLHTPDHLGLHNILYYDIAYSFVCSYRLYMPATPNNWY